MQKAGTERFGKVFVWVIDIISSARHDAQLPVLI